MTGALSKLINLKYVEMGHDVVMAWSCFLQHNFFSSALQVIALPNI